MADAITQAFYTRLSGDTATGKLVSMLGTQGSRPAIYTYWAAPAATSGLYVIVTGNTISTPNDTKNSRGRIVERRIYVFGPAGGSTAAVDAAAERIRALFHRHALTITGKTVYIAVAEGPIEAPTDDSLYGRMVGVTLTMQET